jgi:SnoaL-like domain
MRESPELRELASRLLAAAAGGDEAALLAALAQDPSVVVIGTDPGEWHVGYEKCAELLQGPHEDYDLTGGTVAEAEVRAYETGEVGWAACRGNVTFPGQAPIPLRLTLVCQREKDAWHVVQWHVSIGVPNEDAFQETVVIQTG